MHRELARGARQCPVVGMCAWVRAGQPAYDGPARRVQRFEGTDRQVRGRIMAVLRESLGPVRRSDDRVGLGGRASSVSAPSTDWSADGLVELVGDDRYGLPSRRDTVTNVTAGYDRAPGSFPNFCIRVTRRATMRGPRNQEAP